MSSPLDRLCGAAGPLTPEPPDTEEFHGLVVSAMERLVDADNPRLALRSRFDLAYNAAHALCLAALRRLGYRAKQRYVVFQVLPHTLGLGPEVWRVLDKAHGARNLAEYEGTLNIEERLVLDLITATQAVAAALAALDSH